ncbi:hypothetical protein [Marinobacter sp.]
MPPVNRKLGSARVAQPVDGIGGKAGNAAAFDFFSVNRLRI